MSCVKMTGNSRGTGTIQSGDRDDPGRVRVFGGFRAHPKSCRTVRPVEEEGGGGPPEQQPGEANSPRKWTEVPRACSRSLDRSSRIKGPSRAPSEDVPLWPQDTCLR